MVKRPRAADGYCAARDGQQRGRLVGSRHLRTVRHEFRGVSLAEGLKVPPLDRPTNEIRCATGSLSAPTRSICGSLAREPTQTSSTGLRDNSRSKFFRGVPSKPRPVLTRHGSSSRTTTLG